jgi:hypothetical protein
MDMAVHLTRSDHEEAENGRSECEGDEDMKMDTKNNKSGDSDTNW